MKRIRTCIAIGSLLAGMGAPLAARADFSAMYVFGDSNSDTGRRLTLQGTKPASPPYFMGRHSNGPVAVEYVAGALGLDTPSRFVNYAVGGALSGHGNVDLDASLASTGLLDQLDTFKAGHAAADANALYFVYGGDNDINTCRTGSPCTATEIGTVVDNLEALVQGLSDYGARHFMVIGSYGGGTDKDTFRAQLLAAMQGLDTTLSGTVTYFSARPVLLQMIGAGNPYGFTQTSSASPCYTGSLLGGGTVCSDPQSYLFWDQNGHLTAPAHEILGGAMAHAMPVPEPASYAMLLSGAILVSLCAGGSKRRQARGA